MSNAAHLQLIDNENVYDKNKVQAGTVLAFDFGERRIGIAVGEHLINNANALMTIDNESNEVRFAAITQLINEWQPKLLVVGLPLSLDGSETEVTQL
jgi:putative Holliday junction resolvase